MFYAAVTESGTFASVFLGEKMSRGIIKKEKESELDCDNKNEGNRDENNRNENNKKQRIIAGICIALVVVVLVLCCIFVGIPIIRLAKTPDKFRLWVTEKGVWGPVCFVAIVLFQIVVAFMPGEPFELVAGYAFGAFKGTVLCFLGEALGSVLVLLLVRKFGIRILEIFFSKEKIEGLKFLHTSNKKTMIFTILFLLPGTPKDLLCYFAGLTDIPLGLLMFICIVCRFPSIISSTLGGDALGTGNYIGAVIVFVITFAISLAGIFVYNRIQKRNNNGG